MYMSKTDLRSYFMQHLPKPKTEPVDSDHAIFPEANLALRELPALEALGLVEGATRPDGTQNLKALCGGVLIACLVDAQDAQPFLQAADRDELLGSGMSFIQPLMMQAMELCGLGEDAKAIAKKNLSPILTDSPPLVLPTDSATSTPT